jgi:polysaccharide transporter, PST family
MELNEIQRRSRQGPLFMLGRRAFAVIIGLLTTVVMPHFLRPADYGLAAMAGMVFTLGEMFKDFGLGSALLRKGTINAEEVTFLFWFNIGTTAVISTLIAVTSPLAALFFHQKAVTAIILVSLAGFVMSGIAMQHRGLLNRNLRFAEIALIDSLSLLLQFVLTLLLAIRGLGVWSIVAGNISYSAINGLLCILRSRWKPGRPRLVSEMRAILAFGANTSIYSLALFFSTNITPLLIGNTQSVASLGQYTRANAFLSLPLNNLVEPLAQATLPVLARLRPYPELYRTTYLNFLQRLNLAVLPAAAFLLLAARPLVEATLGSNWREAGDLLAILAPVIGALGFGYAVSDLFITQDRSAELRSLGLAELVVRVGAVFIGVRFGIYGAAGAYMLATLSVVVARVYVASRSGPVSFADHVATALPAAPIAAGVALGCGIGFYVSDALASGLIVRAIIITGASTVLALGAMLMVGVSRRAVFALFRSMRGGTGAE